MAEEVVVLTLPDCDFHKRKGETVEAKYDGRTVYGAWANMCEEDWETYGVGKLGTGYGQRLILGRRKS